MSFTKGPWQQDKYGSVQDASGESIQFRGVSTLCSGSVERIAEAEANTRLIAAAPDLLVAALCEEAMYLPEREGIPILEANGWSFADRFELSASAFVARLRRAAIAKAKGEQP